MKLRPVVRVRYRVELEERTYGEYTTIVADQVQVLSGGVLEVVSDAGGSAEDPHAEKERYRLFAPGFWRGVERVRG